MKNLILSIIILSIMGLLSYCSLLNIGECEKHIARELTDEERKIIPYRKGDVIKFRDKDSNSFYLECTKYEFGRDTMEETGPCTIIVKDWVSVDLETNIKINGDKLFIHIGLGTVDDSNEDSGLGISLQLTKRFNEEQSLTFRTQVNTCKLLNSSLQVSSRVEVIDYYKGIAVNNTYLLLDTIKDPFETQIFMDSIYYSIDKGFIDFRLKNSDNYFKIEN